MTIEFTQYLLPDGRKKKVLIERPPEIEEIAHDLIGKGCIFDIEMLSTGAISMTCMFGEENMLAIEVCANGPEVETAVDSLVKAANESFKKL